MIPDFEIPKCPEFEVKSKIGKLFTSGKILEKYSVRIYEIDPYFDEHHKEKLKVDKNRRKYILPRIDVQFTEYFLAVEIDVQNYGGRVLIFEKKDKRHYKKNLVAYLLELIQVTQKAIMMHTIKLGKYKYLSVNLKKNE